MIRNGFKLSFLIDAPNNKLNQDMIVLSYPVHQTGSKGI